MIENRAAGILLHPTSLPSPHGIGDLGAEAYRFIDFLQAAGIRLWQILPLGPCGHGNSPYSAVSSFAGNPLLLSLEKLAEDGLVNATEIAENPGFPDDHVDYELVSPWKMPLLRKAAARFLQDAENSAPFREFCTAEEWWLEDFALYTALQDHFSLYPAEEPAEPRVINRYWERDIALREPEALERWRSRFTEETALQKALQFLFFRQWRRLKTYAGEAGVEIVGDVPIFVAPDSADVWAFRSNFQIDDHGRLKALAGVPPDYFSAEGQLWGNPLFDWDAMSAEGYAWWLRRLEAVLRQVDWVRIDHFRAFQAYWRIPADAESAKEGEWIKAPGADFFRVLKSRMGELPIIAEDLGIITDEVHELRRAAGLPGMKVLQFAFEFDSEGVFRGSHAFLPHNQEPNSVVYTGTHDNDTTAGWYASRDEKTKDIIRRYLARDGHDIVWDLIRLALSSPAGFAIIPFQDLLGLGSEARMNTPSTVGAHNWAYRFRSGEANEWISGRLYEMNMLYGRL